MSELKMRNVYSDDDRLIGAVNYTVLADGRLRAVCIRDVADEAAALKVIDAHDRLDHGALPPEVVAVLREARAELVAFRGWMESDYPPSHWPATTLPLIDRIDALLPEEGEPC